MRWSHGTHRETVLCAAMPHSSTPQCTRGYMHVTLFRCTDVTLLLRSLTVSPSSVLVKLLFFHPLTLLLSACVSLFREGIVIEICNHSDSPNCEIQVSPSADLSFFGFTSCPCADLCFVCGLFGLRISLFSPQESWHARACAARVYEAECSFLIVAYLHASIYAYTHVWVST